jgi:hypothetical protein
MTDLITRAFKGNRIRINPTSKFVCLNDICKADGKQLKNFLRNQNTADFISELSFVAQIRATNLLVEGKGSAPTWGHPQLAIKCAAWCSAKFEVLMTSWVWELFTTGRVELIPTNTQEALPKTESDRVINMASTVAKPQPIKVTRDRMNLPGYFQIRELVAKYCKDDALAKNSRFHHFISRQFADLYRALYSQEPPRVTRGKYKGYCYPESFVEPVIEYIERWKSIQAST